MEIPRKEKILQATTILGSDLEPLDDDIIRGLSEVVMTADGPVTKFDQLACKFCGGVHVRKCPAVARVGFYENGAIREIEYWKEWDASNVIWRDQLYEGDGK